MKNLPDGNARASLGYSKSQSTRDNDKHKGSKTPKTIGYSPTLAGGSSPSVKEPSSAQLKELIINVRKNMRSSVLNRQSEMNGPVCPVCGGDLKEAEVHEVFLTRGDVQGTPADTQVQIHRILNCVSIHPGDCHLKAQHEQKYKNICARFILKKEGDKVTSWLTVMDAILKGGSAKQAIQWIKELQYEDELESRNG